MFKWLSFDTGIALSFVTIEGNTCLFLIKQKASQTWTKKVLDRLVSLLREFFARFILLFKRHHECKSSISLNTMEKWGQVCNSKRQQQRDLHNRDTLPLYPGFCVSIVYISGNKIFFSMKHAFCIPNFCLRILDLKKKTWNPVDFLWTQYSPSKLSQFTTETK